MSLYRQAGPPRAGRLLAGGLAVLVVGLLAGFGSGRATAPEPSAADLVARLRTDLQPVASGLAILPTEYPQAAAGAGNETAAVRGGLTRVRAALRHAEPELRLLDADGTAALVRAVGRVDAAVGRQAAPTQVERLVQQATDALHHLPGGR